MASAQIFFLTSGPWHQKTYMRPKSHGRRGDVSGIDAPSMLLAGHAGCALLTCADVTSPSPSSKSLPHSLSRPAGCCCGRWESCPWKPLFPHYVNFHAFHEADTALTSSLDTHSCDTITVATGHLCCNCITSLVGLWARNPHLCACLAGLVSTISFKQRSQHLAVRPHDSAGAGGMPSGDSENDAESIQCHI